MSSLISTNTLASIEHEEVIAAGQTGRTSKDERDNGDARIRLSQMEIRSTMLTALCLLEPAISAAICDAALVLTAKSTDLPTN